MRRLRRCEPKTAEASEVKSLGKKTAPMLKFRHADTPRSAREFKRKYPAEFEALKGQTGGRDFTDETLVRLRSKYEGPVDWMVVESTYDPGEAIYALREYLRHRPNAPDAEYVATRLQAMLSKKQPCDPQRVILLCVEYEQLELTERQERILDGVSRAAGQSGHPHADPPLFCIGWVRYCDNGSGTWLIVEVQTDLNGVRRATQQPHMIREMRAQGLAPAEVVEVLDMLEPWHERFYEDAVGFLLERAAAEEVAVEMVDYSYKQDEDSPRSIYTDLPRSMGMKLSDGSEVLATGRTWKITPNKT